MSCGDKCIDLYVKFSHDWSHQRRDILRAATGFPSVQAWRDAWIERSGELFHLARLRRQAWRPDLPLDGQDARYRACHARLEACLHGIFETVRKELHELCAAGILELLSLQRHREGLSVFLRDPRVPLDNNASERVLRGPVIARHTCFGSGGPDGARVAGLMFDVFATLRLAGLNPYTWVLDYLDACADNCRRSPDRLAPWLPWRVDEDRKRELRGPPSLRLPDFRRAGRDPYTRPLRTAPWPQPPADRTAVRTRPRGLPRLAPVGSQATAGQCVCRIDLPPAGLPPARTAPDLASPPLEADSPPLPPAVQPHTEWLHPALQQGDSVLDSAHADSGYPSPRLPRRWRS